jgi:hypothetical protein
MDFADLIKSSILEIAKNPDEAQRIVSYLESLDWSYLFSEEKPAHERKVQGVWERDWEGKKPEIDVWSGSLQESSGVYSLGAGFCDYCDNAVEDVYPFRYIDFITIGWLYRSSAHRNFFPSGDGSDLHWMRDDIERVRRDGRYCLACVSRLEDSIGVINPLRPCDGCKKAFPDSLLDWHEKVQPFKYGYCPSCFNKRLEQVKITCTQCGERTAEYPHHNSIMCAKCSVEYGQYPIVKSNLLLARRRGLPATLTDSQWKQTLDDFENTCAYCRSGPYQVLEHFLPLSSGRGGTTASNCVPACFSCNSLKSSHLPEEIPKLRIEDIERVQAYLARRR